MEAWSRLGDENALEVNEGGSVPGARRTKLASRCHSGEELCISTDLEASQFLVIRETEPERGLGLS